MTDHVQGSYFATKETAAAAVRFALPAIEAAMRQPKLVGDSGFLHIVIMDPAIEFGEAAFESAILHEHSVGDRSRWDADYAAYAKAKARLSWRFGCSSHLVQALKPQCLRAGDTSLWGSAVLDGIVVGASGALPWFDEAFAAMVAACLRALIKGKAAAEPGRLAL
ncbi:MAG: hypothetical protein JWR80_6397 [Bradyrhizobium sp.]|nr:hypothetical protein [Bradyrhizobium sp.]